MSEVSVKNMKSIFHLLKIQGIMRIPVETVTYWGHKVDIPFL